MGLDMYLTKEIYVGGRFEHRQVEGDIDLKIEGESVEIPAKKVAEIVIDIGYWRKANHIHRWFVENCQDGEDNCQKAWVTKDQLVALKNLCEEVLKDKSKAHELLPRQEGFFFGNTEYDEWYFDDIKNTVKIIDEALEEKNNGYFYYRSSW